MPSLFEPGGIVQHEFFLGGAPVIAYRTGGLKDTVNEFNWENNTGNGICFEKFEKNDFIEAVKRSRELFKNKEKYGICQKNAFKSVVDVTDVSKNYCKEFYRLKNKIFFGFYKKNDNIKNNDDNFFIENEYNYRKNKDIEINNIYNNLDIPKSNKSINTEKINYIINPLATKLPHDFEIKFKNKKPKSVLISGSFDNWEQKHPLIYDISNNSWKITLNIKKGKYYYKYIVDGNWQINIKEKSEKDENGILNNYIII